MFDHNDNSTLVALRELRRMEQRRTLEEEQARAKAEAARQEEERAETARTAREQAEREAARQQAMAAKNQLLHELDVARDEVNRLRGQLAAAQEAARPVPLPTPPVPGPRRPVGWIATSATAATLACVLAFQLLGRPDRPVGAQPAPTSAPICPRPPKTAPTVVAVDTPPAPTPPTTAQLKRRPRPVGLGRPATAGPASTTPKCDGTDPLCGLDPGLLEGTGKRHPRDRRR